MLGAGFVSTSPAERAAIKRAQLRHILAEGRRPADWQRLNHDGDAELGLEPLELARVMAPSRGRTRL